MKFFPFFNTGQDPRGITMSSWKYLSGYQICKLKEKWSDEISKCQKLSNYFTMSSLSTPTDETSQASTSETSDSVQTVGALSSNIQPTIDTFGTDDDHSGQHESAMEWEEKEQKQETGSKFCDFKEYIDLPNWPITVDNNFIQNCLMQEIIFFSKSKTGWCINWMPAGFTRSKTEVSQTNTLKKDWKMARLWWHPG